MKIQTIPFSELAKQSVDVYKNVVVSAKRATQIIDERVMARQPIEEVADDGYGVSEQIIDEDYVEPEKAIVVALEEFLDNQLEWQDSEEPSDA